jgi:thiamine biosynthesis lipoprotein
MSPCVETRRARPLLGTFVEIAARASDEAVLQRAVAVGFIAVAQVHGLMNRHDPLSEVSRLNREAARRKVRVHRWTQRVLRAAQLFAQDSEGAFDITLGAEASWRDIELDTQGCVRFHRPLTIDLGGIAKGFAVDRAVETMKKAGALAGIVNAGGDLRTFGDEAQAIQVRHPLNPGRPATTLLLYERALATSASYFAPVLVNARTGKRIENNISITVSAPNCLTADALTKIGLSFREEATALFARHKADAFLLERNFPPRWLARD